MKRIIKTAVLLMIVTLWVACSMRLSSQELGEHVAEAINENLAQNEILSELKVSKVTLIHESGNKYSGIATIVDDEGESVDFDVTVIYDGESFKWEIPNFVQQLMSSGL